MVSFGTKNPYIYVYTDIYIYTYIICVCGLHVFGIIWISVSIKGYPCSFFSINGRAGCTSAEGGEVSDLGLRVTHSCETKPCVSLLDPEGWEHMNEYDAIY